MCLQPTIKKDILLHLSVFLWTPACASNCCFYCLLSGLSGHPLPLITSISPFLPPSFIPPSISSILQNHLLVLFDWFNQSVDAVISSLYLFPVQCVGQDAFLNQQGCWIVFFCFEVLLQDAMNYGNWRLEVLEQASVHSICQKQVWDFLFLCDVYVLLSLHSFTHHLPLSLSLSHLRHVYLLPPCDPRLQVRLQFRPTGHRRWNVAAAFAHKCLSKWWCASVPR